MQHRNRVMSKAGVALHVLWMVSSGVWRRLDSLDIKYHEANYIKTPNDLMSVSYSSTMKTVRKSIAVTQI